MAEVKCRETVGVFRDESTLRSAADALLIAGFDRSSLSLLAGHARLVASLGHDCENIAELEDDPDVPRRHYVGIDSRVEGEAAIIGGLVYASAVIAVGVVAAAGGSTVAALVAAAIVAALAGFAGYAVVRMIEQRRRRGLMAHIRRGGIPLWVCVTTPEQERRANDILRRHGAEHVRMYDMPGARYLLHGGESRELSFMRALGL